MSEASFFVSELAIRKMFLAYNSMTGERRQGGLILNSNFIVSNLIEEPCDNSKWITSETKKTDVRDIRLDLIDLTCSRCLVIAEIPFLILIHKRDEKLSYFDESPVIDGAANIMSIFHIIRKAYVKGEIELDDVRKFVSRIVIDDACIEMFYIWHVIR